MTLGTDGRSVPAVTVIVYTPFGCDRMVAASNRPWPAISSPSSVTMQGTFQPNLAMHLSIAGIGAQPGNRPRLNLARHEDDPACTAAVIARRANNELWARAKIRDEFLNETLLRNLAHARDLIAAMVIDYNTARPHSALGYQTPAGFALHPTTAIARPAARGEGSARRAIAQPAPIGVNQQPAPVAAG